MNSFLQAIVAHKQEEVALLKQQRAEAETVMSPAQQPSVRYATPGRFKQTIAHRAVIAEIKKKSPSLGTLTTNVDITSKIDSYVHGSANAISILTDQTGFNGHLNDLIAAKQYTKQADIPLLRKDFILDEIQIIESIQAGADAILLIVALLDMRTETLLQFARQCGIDAIIEVHTEAELTYALSIDAEIIGINNRDLHTLNIDINRSFELVQCIPAHIRKIAESGIDSVTTVHQLYAAGFDAVLVGSFLMQHADPAAIIQAMRRDHE